MREVAKFPLFYEFFFGMLDHLVNLSVRHNATVNIGSKFNKFQLVFHTFCHLRPVSAAPSTEIIYFFILKKNPTNKYP
jgi:hypothetical protein